MRRGNWSDFSAPRSFISQLTQFQICVRTVKMIFLITIYSVCFTAAMSDNALSMDIACRVGLEVEAGRLIAISSSVERVNVACNTDFPELCLAEVDTGLWLRAFPSLKTLIICGCPRYDQKQNYFAVETTCKYR